MESNAQQSAGNWSTLSRESRAPGNHQFLTAAFAVAALLCGSLPGCRGTPQLTTQEQEGKHLYSGRCAHCHEDNDLGLKKVPPDLHHLFDRSNLPSGAAATDANVQVVVLAGKGMMPSFAGRFTNEQMNDLLAYLHTGLR